MQFFLLKSMTLGPQQFDLFFRLNSKIHKSVYTAEKQNKEESLELARSKMWALQLQHCAALQKLFIELKDRANLHQVQCQTHMAKQLSRATSIAWNNMILHWVNVN